MYVSTIVLKYYKSNVQADYDICILNFYMVAIGKHSMSEDHTSIWVSDELWEELNSRKKRGDTFEDVIWKLIEQADENPEDS